MLFAHRRGIGREEGYSSSRSHKMAGAREGDAEDETINRSRGASTSHGMFSRLNLTVECPTEFGQTVHVSGSSFLAGVSNPSLVSPLRGDRSLFLLNQPAVLQCLSLVLLLGEVASPCWRL